MNVAPADAATGPTDSRRVCDAATLQISEDDGVVLNPDDVDGWLCLARMLHVEVPYGAVPKARRMSFSSTRRDRTGLRPRSIRHLMPPSEMSHGGVLGSTGDDAAGQADD